MNNNNKERIYVTLFMCFPVIYTTIVNLGQVSLLIVDTSLCTSISLVPWVSTRMRKRLKGVILMFDFKTVS